MGKYFGTDGFRGEVGVTLLPTQAYELGRFFGWYIGILQGRRARVLLAKDTRLSADMLQGALCAGLCASGADVYLLGVAPTPALAYLVEARGYDFGVMLSASHNPFWDNGIKVFDHSGEKPKEEFLALAEAYLDGCLSCFGKAWESLPFARAEAVGRVMPLAEEIEYYIEHLVQFGKDVPRGARLALDLANGATTAVAKRVFERLGVELVWMGDAPNGTNINAACGSTHPGNLLGLVRREGAYLGFAFDGDGDRVLASDENGALVDGDGILYILARKMKAQGGLKGDMVVATILSNGGLAASLAKDGIGLVLTKVGDQNVYQRMCAEGYSLGGEQSGHIILGDSAKTGDGILTALALLSCLDGQSLREALGGLHLLAQVSENIPIQRRGVLKQPEMQTIIYNLERQLGQGGRLVVRESGTEPLLRLMAEGESLALCQETIREARTLLEENLDLCAES